MAEYAGEADYAPEPVSDAEKLTIATHMLMSSPPGQFCDVLIGGFAKKKTTKRLSGWRVRGQGWETGTGKS